MWPSRRGGSFNGAVGQERPSSSSRRRKTSSSEAESKSNSAALISGRKTALTAINTKVLEGVAAGVSTVQLAALLYLSRGGVEYDVTTLMRKFKVANRPALISKAYSMGVFVLGSWPPRVLPEYTKQPSRA